MQKCPNCGQPAARTEDWACQWCGYPLLSRSYKKIPKTYKQLKEERLPVREEPEPVSEPEPVLEPEVVLESEPEPVPEPEPVAKPKRRSVAKAKAKPAAKAKPKSKAKPASKAEVKAAAEPEPVPEHELVLESEPEPKPAAIEITVEGLLAAYDAERVAADAKFVNKILNVTGVVDRIEVKDILNIHYISLGSAEKTLLQNVRCVFDKKYGPELSQLTIGQKVTVQGKYDGSIMDIRMRDCVLVH